MIRMICKTNDGKEMIFLGLSDLNMEMLTKGLPIKFDLSELGLPSHDVVIFNGRSEKEMHENFKSLFTSETQFKDYTKEEEN